MADVGPEHTVQWLLVCAKDALLWRLISPAGTICRLSQILQKRHCSPSPVQRWEAPLCHPSKRLCRMSIWHWRCARSQSHDRLLFAAAYCKRMPLIGRHPRDFGNRHRVHHLKKKPTNHRKLLRAELTAKRNSVSSLPTLNLPITTSSIHLMRLTAIRPSTAKEIYVDPKTNPLHLEKWSLLQSAVLL